ncbi:hypothetical protein ACTZWW_03125 [Salinarimonas sp. NSM]|uniref:hypothetical protein n=1 Tax=Salinarimonas sp. NSM TaxID=3458003 RepID=UPI004036729F
MTGFLLTVRKRGILNRTRARDVTRDERRGLGIGPDVPAVGLELATCGETISVVAPAAHHVDREAIVEPVAILGTGFRHRPSEARRYMGAVVALASLPDAALAEIAEKLTGRVTGCEKARAGRCDCASRHAPLAVALAAAAGPWSAVAQDSMGRAAGLERSPKSAAVSEQVDVARGAIAAIVRARKPIQAVHRAPAWSGAAAMSEARR